MARSADENIILCRRRGEAEEALVNKCRISTRSRGRKTAENGKICVFRFRFFLDKLLLVASFLYMFFF